MTQRRYRFLEKTLGTANAPPAAQAQVLLAVGVDVGAGQQRRAGAVQRQHPRVAQQQEQRRAAAAGQRVLEAPPRLRPCAVSCRRIVDIRMPSTGHAKKLG